MSKLEKRLIIFALVFVVIYMGAVAMTIRSRIGSQTETVRLESARAGPGEAHLMLAELFLPMMILLAVAVSFIVVRKRVAKELALEASIESPIDFGEDRPDAVEDDPPG